MRLRRPAVALLALLVAASAYSAAYAKKPTALYYLSPGSVDLAQLLEPPPDPASRVAQDDLRTLALVAAARTPADVAAARADAHRDVFDFADVMGPKFVAGDLPLTAQLFAHASGDTELLVAGAKAFFGRPRPSGAPQTHGSYPSGHAAFAACTAILLSDIVPERRDAVFERATVFANGRIVAGVHYPSDVEAGWIAGTIVAYALFREPRFQHDFAAVRAEVRAALGLPAATSTAAAAFGKP